MSWSNPTQAHAALRRFREGQGGPLRELRNLGRAGKDTLILLVDAEGEQRLRVEITDARGEVWSAARSYVISGPPTVRGVRAAYDTSKGRTTLSWNPVRREGMAGYIVYAWEGGVLRPLHSVPLKDTVFTHTVHADSQMAADKALIYTVKVKDNAGRLSRRYSDEVHVRAPSPWQVTTHLAFRDPERIQRLQMVGDTVYIAAEYRNPGRSHDSLVWYLEGKMEPLRALGPMGKSGTDTLRLVFDRPGFHRITLTSQAEGGRRYSSPPLGFFVFAVRRVWPDTLERGILHTMTISGSPDWFDRSIHTSLPPQGMGGIRLTLTRGGQPLEHNRSGLLRPDTLITFTRVRVMPDFTKGPADLDLEFPADHVFYQGGRFRLQGAVYIGDPKPPTSLKLEPDSGRREDHFMIKLSGPNTRFRMGNPTMTQIDFVKAGEQTPRFSDTRTLEPTWYTQVDSSGTFVIKIPADAPLGAYDLRVRQVHGIKYYSGQQEFVDTLQVPWPLFPGAFRVVE